MFLQFTVSKNRISQQWADENVLAIAPTTAIDDSNSQQFTFIIWPGSVGYLWQNSGTILAPLVLEYDVWRIPFPWVAPFRSLLYLQNDDTPPSVNIVNEDGWCPSLQWQQVRIPLLWFDTDELPYLGLDEDYWYQAQSSGSFSYWSRPSWLDSDQLPLGLLGLDEDGWIPFQSWVSAQYRSIWQEQDELSFVSIFDEDGWYQQRIQYNPWLPYLWYDTDESSVTIGFISLLPILGVGG